MMSIPIAVLLAQSRKRPIKWWFLLALGYGMMELFGVAWHLFVGFTPLLDLATLGGLLIWGLLAWECVGGRR